MIRFIAAIASVISRKKANEKKRKRPEVSKAQSREWIREGKCQYCGTKTKNFTGTCEECELN